MRIQDVCAHVTPVTDVDFFLCSGILWYWADSEDYAGPDSPRSEWTWPGVDQGGRRGGSSRSPRVTPHCSLRLAAYIPEWEVGFEPRLLRTPSINSQESATSREIVEPPEPWSGIASLPRDLGTVSQTSHFKPVAAVLA